MVTHVSRNFCIAPFSQFTLSPSGRYSPCPEIGARLSKIANADPYTMWNSEVMDELRQSFLENKRHVACDRCWKQEDLGKISLRKNLLTQNISGGAKFKKGELNDWLDYKYKQGPKQINLIVGNKCNLRCRYCGTVSSVTYSVEGKVYADQIKDEKQSHVYFRNSLKPNEFSPKQIEELFQFSKNLTRLEFYGGEPLLDKPTLILLEKLIASGQSKEIALFYNTNCVTEITSRQFELWNQFKSIEFNCSVDDVANRFHYIRHPGQWLDFTNTLQKIRTYSWDIPFQTTAITTVGNLNVFYLPEIIETLTELNLKVYLNTIHNPDWYDIRSLPMPIKEQIADKLKQSRHINHFQFVLNYLKENENLENWEKFKTWTKMKDQYRQENFVDVYPEFYSVIKQYEDFYNV